MKDVLFMTNLIAFICKLFPLKVPKVIVFRSVSDCSEATLLKILLKPPENINTYYVFHDLTNNRVNIHFGPDVH